MIKNKTILLFLLKALVVYAILSAPFAVYNDYYAKFYRACATKLFRHFEDSGLARFSPGPTNTMTHINVGNLKQLKPGGQLDTTFGDVNTRYLGYLPTALL